MIVKCPLEPDPPCHVDVPSTFSALLTSDWLRSLCHFGPRPAIRTQDRQKLLEALPSSNPPQGVICLIPPLHPSRKMDQTALFSPSPQVAVLPKVFTSRTLSIPLNPEFASLQASPLSSPTQLTRRLPRTHSRSQLSSRASLESIIEESSNDNFEHTATHATSNPTPDFTGAKERNWLTVSRPPGWNGKKGITTGRGMRDVCGIWYVGYSAWYYSPVSISQ
jgi:hypothetical protein